MSTLLCVPIMVHDVHSALADAASAKEAGADLVEFRIDEFFSGELTEAGGAPTHGSEADVLRLVGESPLPCIVTCRHSSEGGRYDGDEDARVSLYQRLGTASGKGEHPPRYLDFELDQYSRSANIRQKVNLAVDASELRGEGSGARRDLAPSLILSNHDFDGRPADFSRRVLRMHEQPAAAVCKFAFRARSLRDNMELFDLLTERERPTIALAMGEFGLMSRVLAPKFGGFLTFASLRSTSTTAPGQPTVRELLDLYRFRSINAKTKVYGVVGWPVGHSLSPLVHNAGFDAVGYDGVYLPLPIAAEESGSSEDDSSYASFKATVLALLEHPRLDLSGLSVTIPHKENLVRLAREEGWNLDALSAMCGAGNSLAVGRFNGKSSIRVFNTDAPAALSCLADAVGALKGLHLGVLGAGGVARAIVCALGQEGARVTVYNRSVEKARKLAAECENATGATVNGEALPEGGTSSGYPHAWVNCTPLGMAGGPDPAASAIPEHVIRNLAPTTAVLDTVYNPVRTPLLKAAEEAGLQVIDGVNMFVRQAGEQFSAWTGTKAPMNLFEKLVRDTLAAKASPPQA